MSQKKWEMTLASQKGRLNTEDTWMMAVLRPMLQHPLASCIQVLLPMTTEYRRGLQMAT